MKHVRFAAMAEGFLRETVRAWPALRSVEGKEMLFDAVLPLVGGTKPVPRWGSGPRVIYILGGNDGTDNVRTAELFDPLTASWKQLASMTSTRTGPGCIALDGKLYAMGGRGDVLAARNLVLETAEVYDPQTDGWQPLANMSTARCGFMLATVGGKIYAIGGWDDNSALDSVEAYDPQLGAWTPVASMSVERSDHATVVIDGKIYTIGGQRTDEAAVDTVEVYDPQADSWQRVASMPQGLFAHAAAVMGGKIYVTGGIREGHVANPEMLVCMYDPQADAWTQLASMSASRRAHASAVVGGKLYVFGGSGDGGHLNTAEVYDPTSNSWAQGLSLTSVRSDIVAVAL